MKNKISSTRPENKNAPVSKIYLIGFCLILALPLLSLPPLFDPPDWGKTIIFRIIVSLLALFFGYQILFKKITVNFHLNWHKPASWVVVLFVALFLLYGLSTALSVDIGNSLWGDPYRAGGVVNVLFLFAYSAIIYLLVRRDDFIVLFKTAIFTGLIVAIIGLFQRFGIFASVFQKTTINITSTIGGPNFLSLYLLILFFLAVYLFIRETKTSYRILYGVIISVFITTIYFCISQATYLGLGAGIVCLVLFFPKNSRSLTVSRIAIVGAIIIIVGTTVYLKNNSDNPLSKSPLFSWHIDNSRLSAWKISWEAIKNRPLFGYGPENYSIAFNRYYDPKLPEVQIDPYYKSSWWDRPHNVFFEVATNIGIVGLVAYLSFFGLLIWKLVRVKPANNNLNDNPDFDTILISRFLVAIFIAYFTNLFFAFDTFSSSLLIFTIIAFSLKIIDRPNKIGDLASDFEAKHGKLVNADGKTKTTMVLLVIVTGWFIYNYNLKPLIANSQINIAQKMAIQGDCSKAIELADTSNRQNTIISGYLQLRSTEVLKCGISHYNEPEYTNRINQIIAVLKKSADISPQNPKAWLYLSEFTILLLDKENDPVIKNDLLNTVNGYLEKVKALSPKRQEIYLSWAKANISANNYSEAFKKATKCRDLNPNLGECYWLMAISQIYLGTENTQIIGNLQLAKDYGYDSESIPSLKILVNAYIATNNFTALIEPLQKLIILNPTISDYHGQLAVVYKELGDYEKAKDEALKLLELESEAKDEVEEFVKSLPPTTSD